MIRIARSIIRMAPLLAGVAAASACASQPEAAEPVGSSEVRAAASAAGVRPVPAAAPAPGELVRVSGEAKPPEFRDGSFYWGGRLAITTPLPDGYPAPTPPNAVEIKTYPPVRRAEFAAPDRLKAKPDSGMSTGFWPLFNHIKKRDIAMTSPVEMDYNDVGPGPKKEGIPPDAAARAEAMADESLREGEASRTADGWTMSFLYRSADLGPVGEDGNVVVVDKPQVTMVAIGIQGGYSKDKIEKGVQALEAWLASQDVWEAAGPARAMYYNGPEKWAWDKWSEAQLPIRLKAAETGQPVAKPAKE